MTRILGDLEDLHAIKTVQGSTSLNQEQGVQLEKQAREIADMMASVQQSIKNLKSIFVDAKCMRSDGDLGDEALITIEQTINDASALVKAARSLAKKMNK